MFTQPSSGENFGFSVVLISTSWLLGCAILSRWKKGDPCAISDCQQHCVSDRKFWSPLQHQHTGCRKIDLINRPWTARQAALEYAHHQQVREKPLVGSATDLTNAAQAFTAVAQSVTPVRGDRIRSWYQRIFPAARNWPDFTSPVFNTRDNRHCGEEMIRNRRAA